eukprot:COSAG02_NODE_438_length_22319_cov_17.198425_12_plen_431_part_00
MNSSASLELALAGFITGKVSPAEVTAAIRAQIKIQIDSRQSFSTPSSTSSSSSSSQLSSDEDDEGQAATLVLPAAGAKVSRRRLDHDTSSYDPHTARRQQLHQIQRQLNLHGVEARRIDSECRDLARQELELKLQLAASHNSSPTCRLLSLPAHLLVNIAAYLSVGDLGRWVLVCKRFTQPTEAGNPASSILEATVRLSISRECQEVKERAARLENSQSTLPVLRLLFQAQGSSFIWTFVDGADITGIGTDTVETTQNGYVGAIGNLSASCEHHSWYVGLDWMPDHTLLDGDVPKLTIGAIAASSFSKSYGPQYDSRAVCWQFGGSCPIPFVEGSCLGVYSKRHTGNLDELIERTPLVDTAGHAQEHFRLRLTQDRLTLAHLRTGRSGSIAIPEGLRGSDEWRPVVGFKNPCKVSLASRFTDWDFSSDDY